MQLEFTLQMLQNMRACPSAIQRVESILPVKISTEAEDNRELATRLIEHYKATPRACGVANCWLCRQQLANHLRWLMCTSSISWTVPGSKNGRKLSEDSFNVTDEQGPEHFAKMIAFVAQVLLDKQNAALS